MFASESVSTQLIRKRKELGEAESTLSDIRKVSAEKLESFIGHKMSISALIEEHSMGKGSFGSTINK